MDNKLDELIKCPFCKQQTVFANVLTIYEFLSEHRVKRSGVEFEGESMGQLLGEMRHDPIIRVCSYHCSSCGKEWGYDNRLNLVRGDNGVCWFALNEEQDKKRKGRKNSE